MKIYTAAMFSEMERLRTQVWPELRADGHEMTAQWVEGKAMQEGESGAVMDVEDIDRSDCLMLFTYPRGTLYKGGGRMWEFGYAYGRWRFDFTAETTMRRILIVGPREQIFCYLPTVEICATLDEARDALRRERPWQD